MRQQKDKKTVLLDLARLATLKSAERTLASGILEHPTDPQYGKILYIIDIPLPLVIGEAVEQTIIHNLKEEYFKAERKTPVYQFEDCLKQLNLSLAELAEDGNTDWVGHIHSCIALWADDELFVTHTGRALGMVARGDSLVSIVDSAPSERRVMVHKTFANLTSGQLVAGDTLILGNGEVGRHFSPQFLGQVGQEPPLKAVQNMFQTAKRLNLRFITAIIGQVRSGEMEDVAPETPTVILESGVTVGRNPLAAAPQLTRVAGSVQSLSGQLSGVQSDIAAFVKDAIGNIRQTTQKLMATVQNPKKAEVTFDEPEPSSEHEILEADAPKAAVRPPTLRRSQGQRIDHIIKRVTKSVQQWIETGGHLLRLAPPRLLLGVSLILVLVVGLSVRNRLHHTNTSAGSASTAEARTKIDHITSLLNQATAESSTAPDKARDDLAAVNQDLSSISGTASVSADFNALRDRYFNLLKQLNNVSLVSTKSSLELPKNTAFVAVIGQYLFSAAANSAFVSQQTLGRSDAPQTIYSLPNTTISYLTLIDEEHKLLLMGQNRKLYRLDIDANGTAVELIPPTGESWPDTRAIATYQDNLYVLETATGQIWKYATRDKQHYTTKQAYITTTSLIRPDVTDITSDGNIYSLAKNGLVQKLLKGAPQSFGPVSIPKPDSAFDAAARIFTTSAVNSIYIQDTKRLVELSKEGQYVRQWVLEDGSIDQSFVSPKSKRAWFVQETKLIETSL